MLNLITYNEKIFDVAENCNIKDIKSTLTENSVNWLNLEIQESSEAIDLLKQFDVHHLLIDDTLNFNHLPKIEFFENYIFLTLKILKLSKKKNIIAEHISLILTDKALITVQQGIKGDVFDNVRSKIKNNIGMLRYNSADYLFYQLIDIIVDEYLAIIEQTRDEIQKTEERIFDNKTPDLLKDVATIKEKVNTVRKFTLPLKDILSKILISKDSFIQKSTSAYFNDILDHVNHLLSAFEIQREMLKDLLELHETKLSNETNQIMKILTIVSTIFIPLTFIAGIYGMNFKYMPELDWKWSYPILIFMMLILGIIMFLFIKKKKWF